MAQHEVLGPLFISLNLGSLLARPKAGQAFLLQNIAQAQSQRIFGSHDYKGDLVFLAPLGNSLKYKKHKVLFNGICFKHNVIFEFSKYNTLLFYFF